jgi:hypothetical protein
MFSLIVTPALSGKNGHPLLMTKLIKLLGVITLLFCANVKAQSVAEVDPEASIRIGWDYVLPDENVIGFRIYKQVITGEEISWSLVGDVISPVLEFDLPKPVLGTYIVRAYNTAFESPDSEQLTLIPEPPVFSVPLAPTNLRAIEIPK